MIIRLIKQSECITWTIPSVILLRGVELLEHPFHLDFYILPSPTSPTHPLTDKDAAAARERLEKDLHSTKAVLKQRSGDQTDGVGSAVADSQDRRPSSDTEVSGEPVYGTRRLL